VQRLTVVFAAVAAVLISAGPAAGAARPWHEVVHRADQFVTDASRYAAWTNTNDPSLTLLDTQTGRRRVVGKPAGCALPTGFYDESAASALHYPWVVLSCPIPLGEQVLDLVSGALRPLGGPDDFGWTVGARWAQLQTGCGSEGDHCRRFIDLRTGATQELAGWEPLIDLDAETLAPVRLCPSVARERSRAIAHGLSEADGFSFDDHAILAMGGDLFNGGLALARCGRPTVTVERRASRTPRVGAGWATWDTAINLSMYDDYPRKVPGTVEAVRLRDLARRTWRAPRLRSRLCQYGLTPPRPIGRADHTRTQVFWIATLDGVDNLGCETNRVRVYSTPLRSG